ncbi:MAG: phosphoglycerate kinase [Candidatus Bathyarchaeia archaeon]
MARFLTIDDLDFSGKTVIFRPDFNVPIDPGTGEIIDDSRIREHGETIKELSAKGAKIVVLAHQGRPGERDYLESLRRHAERLSEILGFRVDYVEDIIGETALEAISKLKPGGVLLLKNIRSHPDEGREAPPEEHARSEIVSKLSRVADIFVLDGFSVAHRPHASVVGFAYTLPSCAGRVMERELKALDRVLENPEKPFVCILGGAKSEKSTSIIEYFLGRGLADYILTGGLIGQLLLLASGLDLGSINVKVLEKRGFLKFKDEAVGILRRYNGMVKMPIDVAVDMGGKRVEVSVEDLPSEYPIMDIGRRTIEMYKQIVSNARSILVSGPLGVYEDERFIEGTSEIYRAVALSGAYRIGGGGDTVAALEKLGLRDRFSYVSLAGGAFIEYISGGRLLGVEALELAYRRVKGV